MPRAREGYDLFPHTMVTCPTDNTETIDQTDFLNGHTLHWDAHRIGWTIAGGCTVVTVIISIISILLHCTNYTNPRHQRQIIRVLYLPPVYGVISFLSYRFFRDYTYYSLVQVVYESIALSAFLLLLIEYVIDEQKIFQDRILEKEKRRLLVPLCCFRYRPTKTYFLFAIKWSVLQYTIVRPLITIIGIICQAKNVLCDSEGFNPHYASVYLFSIDFVCISVALYGLFLFYGLTKTELQGKRPVAKFLSIKLIIMFSFYQSFVFKALEGRVIHATQFWTATNIANGLSALAICIEMVFFAALMSWAFSFTYYRRPAGSPATKLWRPLWDSINYYDLAKELYGSGLYFLKPAIDPEKVQVERDPISTLNIVTRRTEHPESSNRPALVTKDDPYDTWVRWQVKEMRGKE